jgi:hypothetical protein
MTDKVEVGQIRIWTISGKCPDPFTISSIFNKSATYFYGSPHNVVRSRTTEEIKEGSRIMTKLEKLLAGL